jgi:hypothetical protein
MKLQTKTYRHFGECLWLENGTWEMGIPLSFGRACCIFRNAEKRTCFTNNRRTRDTEHAGGLGVYGGTRLWLRRRAGMRSMRRSGTVLHEWRGEALTVTQDEDPLLHAVKQSGDCGTG